VGREVGPGHHANTRARLLQPPGQA
jgi:hypothetical protein